MQFGVYLYNREQSLRINDEVEISEYIVNYIELINDYIVLPLSSTCDTWVKTKGEFEIRPNDNFLILGNKKGISSANAAISMLIPGFDSDISEFTIKKYINNEIILIEIENPDKFNTSIFTSNGSFLNKKSFHKKRHYTWSGGVCVNDKTNLFLKRFHSQSIKFEHDDYALKDVLRINDKPVGYDFFINEIDNMIDDTYFTFEFPNKNVAILGIAHNAKPNENVGFEIFSNQTLSPEARAITDNIHYISGNIVHNNNLLNRLPIHILVSIIETIKNGEYDIKLNSDKKLKLENLLIKSSPMLELKIFFRNIFKNDVFLPLNIISEIEKYL